MRERPLTDIRQPKRRILPTGHGPVFVAFLPVVVTDCKIMTPKAFPAKAAFVSANPKSKLMDQLREVMRVKHYRLRMEAAYGQWVRRYLKFHRDAVGTWRHPRDLAPTDGVAFLNHLPNVCRRCGSGNAESSVKCHLVSSRGGVLAVDLADLGEFLLASRRRRLPVVLSKAETPRLLPALTGTWRLMAQTLSGTGIRLMEGLRLRVQGIEFERNQIVVRGGKGEKDRETVLPYALRSGGSPSNFSFS